jgi:hypothetical protein
MLRIVRYIILFGIAGLSSCQKELSCENCQQINKPPVADAGRDQVITLPTDSVLLDGSASHDPDGSISRYQWTKITGPSPFTVSNIARPLVRNLSAGTYVVELKVTDNEGLDGRDTVMIVVDAILTSNHPPVANAGVDQTVFLPANSVNLDGSNSSDPDNNISSYIWTAISGPPTFNMLSPASMQTPVTGLVQGDYRFELKVTDAGGLFDKDTIVVRVNGNSAPTLCVIPGAVQVASFSAPRADLSSTICNNKIYYSDGWTMDVFDPVSNTILNSASLSINRNHVSATTAGDKVIFAGGYIYPPNTTSQGTYVSRVDIYNTTSGTWTTAELSTPRILNAGTCTLGNKVFFAGGLSGPNLTTSRIDIYDWVTNSWTQRELSQPGAHLAVIVQGKIWFITPNSTLIDVYDGATGNWNTMNLSSPVFGNPVTSTYYCKPLQIGNKIYFTGSQQVKVYDLATQLWSAISLSEPKFLVPAVASNGKIVFIGGMTRWYFYSNLMEIYDPATNSWSTRTMNTDLFYESLTSFNNFIYSAGGMADQENTSLSGICRFSL